MSFSTGVSNESHCISEPISKETCHIDWRTIDSHKCNLLAEEELEEFKSNMNTNRVATGERLVYP